MNRYFTQLKERVKYYLYQYRVAKMVFKNDSFYSIYKLSKNQQKTSPSRTEIINFIANFIGAKSYLEIGVRNPNDNFNKIEIKEKYSVDPGVEFRENPVDFKYTSDDFFRKLRTGELPISPEFKFDIIFIDGLHLADQVERDVMNGLDYISDHGFIVMHDCNPPTQFHAREDFRFRSSPARGFWNGTTWKVYYKFRHHPNLFSVCMDSDWGVGLLSKKKYSGMNNIQGKIENPYYEYGVWDKNREKFMNLKKFELWQKEIQS